MGGWLFGRSWTRNKGGRREILIGDGKSSSIWHDKWCDNGVISDLIPIEEIKRIDPELKMKVFWKDIRDEGEIVKWWKLLWYPQCIPRHAFVLWLAIQGRLATQDRIIKWYHGKVAVCPFCQSCPDSHGHLFFAFQFSKKIWEGVLKLIPHYQNASSDWEVLIDQASNWPSNKSVMSMIRRISLATCVYAIWTERNNRLFATDTKDWKTVLKTVINNVRLQLSSIRVKNTTQVKRIEELWNVKMNIQRHEELIIELQKRQSKFREGTMDVGWNHCHYKRMQSAVKGYTQNHREGCLYLVECQPDEAQELVCLVPNTRKKLCLGNKQNGCLGNVVNVGCILEQLLATWMMPVSGIVVLSIGDSMEHEFFPCLDDAICKSLCVGILR
ncbi:reverse transcriptase zinc-binding domain-containing protein [Tanacetum coccineum]